MYLESQIRSNNCDFILGEERFIEKHEIIILYYMYITHTKIVP